MTYQCQEKTKRFSYILDTHATGITQAQETAVLPSLLNTEESLADKFTDRLDHIHS